MARELVVLACSECKNRNYTTLKNKRTMPNRMEVKKFCKFDKARTMHKEVK